MSGEQNDMENRPMNLHFSLACFFALIWAWLAFQCSVWSFILTHSPMPVYYIRKIMFYGAIDMTAQTTRAKIAIGYHIGHLRAEETTPQYKNGYTVRRCRCDCGGEIDAPLHQLTAGYRKSCGCLQEKQLLENLKLCEGTSVAILEANRGWLLPTNASGVTGAYRNRRTERWCAQITFK